MPTFAHKKTQQKESKSFLLRSSVKREINYQTKATNGLLVDLRQVPLYANVQSSWKQNSPLTK